MGLIDSIIGVESGGNPSARNPNSSASGLGQFIDSTWLATIRGARPDLAGQSDQELLALKSDPQLSREMTEAYANQNQAYLTKNGLPVTPGNTYLAHFAGPEGAAKVLQADPNAPAGSVLGQKVLEANPFLAKMTAADLQAWADRKMGTAQPSPAPQPTVAPASGLLKQETGGLLNLLTGGAGLLNGLKGENLRQTTPPANLGIRGDIYSPQMAPQQSGGLLDSMPADQMQAPQIFFAPRRAPDLSRLRAAFKPPVFRG